MQGKVAIVTGASSGIGRAAAAAFAKNGATVVAVGRIEKELKASREEVKSGNGSVRLQLADLLELSQLERVVTETIDNHGQIDCLVNAAGIISNGTIETTTIDDWDRLMNINLRSVFQLTQRCVPHLAETKGNIVNVSSVAGTRAFPNVLAYCVSKAATDQLTRCCGVGAGSERNPGQCGQSRGCRHKPAQTRRNGREKIRYVSRTLKRNTPDRTRRARPRKSLN